MKNIKKRILALWLSVCMALTMMPSMALPVFASSIGKLTITVSDQGVISGNEATASGTLYYYLVSSDPASTIEGWTTDTDKTTVDSNLSVSGDTSAPSLTDSDNGKYLVVVEFDGSEKVVAAGASAAISITASKAIAELTITVSDQGVISGNEATASGTLYYYLVSSDPASNIEGWTTDTEKSAVDSDLSVSGDTSAPSLTDSDNGKYLVVVEFAGSNKVVAAGASAAISITASKAIAELTITVSDQGVISGNEATASGTLYYYLVSSDPASNIEGWTTDTEKSTVDSDLSVSGDTSAPSLTDSDNGKYLVVVEFAGSNKVVAAGASAAISITAADANKTEKPQIEGYEITAAEGDESAVIPLTNSYDGTVTVTVKTAKNGEAAGVEGKYTKESSQITLTFSPKLAAKTTYKISVTEEGKDESEQVEVTVNPYPVTADPVINPNKVTAEADNKSAIFTVTNASDYTGKDVTVNIYDQEGTEVASNVTAAYKDGKLTLTYKAALANETSYKVEFDTADSSPSGKVDITVTPVKSTTATPQVGVSTVYCESNENTTAKVTLTNGHLYTGTPTVTVYKEGQKVESDPTAVYAEGVITLTFTTPVSGEEGQTYQIALTEEGKNESEKLTVAVMPYQSSDNATIGSIVGTFGESDYTAEPDTENSGDGSAPTKAHAYVINLPEGTEITSGTVKLTVDPKATVSYLANTAELESDGGFTGEQSGNNQSGTVTASTLNFSTDKYLYVKVVAENETTTTYYVITVKVTKLKAGTPTTDVTLGNAAYNEALANLKDMTIGEDSQKTIGSAALNAAEANTALAAQMSNEGTFNDRTSAPDSVWGKLYAADNSIAEDGGNITYYYVPYLDINVPNGGYDADAKTLTVDITPKYEVVASTKSTFNEVKLDTDINGVVISTDNTLTGLENITVKLNIPNAIAVDDATVYVQHANDGWNAYTVSHGTVEIVAPSFSNFYIRGTAPGEAMIGTKVYDTVQDAINALTNGAGQEITLLSNDAKVTDLTPPTNGCSSFTIKNGTSVSVDLSTITFKSAVGKDGYTYKASNSNGTITVTWSKDYKVTVNNSGNGSMKAEPTTAKMGDKVTLSIENGTLQSVTASSNGTNVNITEESAGYSFIMPEGDVTVTAVFEGTSGGQDPDPSIPPSPSSPGGSTTPQPGATVSTINPVNGYFSVSSTDAKAGDTVTITTTPDEGYVVDKVTVTDRNGKEVAVTQNEDGTYSFVMPEDAAQPVTVSVTFKEDEGGEVTPPTADPLVFSSKAQERDIANRLTTSKDTSLKLKAADEDVKIGKLAEWDVTSDNEDVVKVLKPGNKLRYMDVGTANITVKATGSDGKVYSIVIPIKVKLGTPTFTLSHYSSKKARTFTVTTSTVRGATGFQVKYSLKKSLKSSKTKTYKCGKKLNRKTIKANKSKRTYYVRVRAYKTVDGERTYGAWSKLTKTIRSR